MRIDRTRNELLTPFGKATLSDRYLLPGEDPQDLFVRVATAFANDKDHAQRLYDYMSQLWFMPATPILSNGGTDRGLNISCFLSEAGDSMESIQDVLTENWWLACRGGGIGTYFGNVRSVGEKIKNRGKTTGVMPFLKIQDSQTLAVSQGSIRRGSAASYLPVWHPEIEEFSEMRRPTGGDPNRKCLNLHHGVVIDDKFMAAIQSPSTNYAYELLSPKDSSVVKTINARDIWTRLLTARIETGEPYLLFIDTVNARIPVHQGELGLKIKMSNLCTEITLPTGLDHLGKQRTAVCCLSSVNWETFEQWRNNDIFILDVMYFLDNVLQDFIKNAPDTHARAKYSAERERSIGLGAMGLHGYYQGKSLPWDSDEAYAENVRLHQHLAMMANEANILIAKDRGACPDAVDAGYETIRFSSMIAIAPTASISIICGGATAGDEPQLANYYLHKTLSGSFAVKNKFLQKLLVTKGKDIPEVWSSIANNEGSVQQLDFLSDHEKLVFRTAHELDQMDIILQAAQRQNFICQAQSINLFIPHDISKRQLHLLHYKAWQVGVKSLYYCRSDSASKADSPSVKVERKVIEEECADGVCSIEPPKQEYAACEACQ